MVEMIFTLGLIFSVILAYIAHKKKWKIADYL